jgi:hypothetical protein
MGNTTQNDSSRYLGWSNEATMFAWGAVNPLGVLISREKPTLCYNNRGKDKIELESFFQRINFGKNLDQIRVEEILDYLYK